MVRKSTPQITLKEESKTITEIQYRNYTATNFSGKTSDFQSKVWTIHMIFNSNIN